MTRPRPSRRGPPGVALVDRRVGLDDVLDLEVVGRVDDALQRRDDPGRGGALEAEGVADRDHRVAHRQARRCARAAGAARRRGTSSARSTARSVLSSRPSTSARALGAVVEGHRGAVLVAEHVGVGEDAPAAVDQEPGAEAPARALLAAGDLDDGRRAARHHGLHAAGRRSRGARRASAAAAEAAGRGEVSRSITVVVSPPRLPVSGDDGQGHRPRRPGRAPANAASQRGGGRRGGRRAAGRRGSAAGPERGHPPRVAADL